MHIKETSKTHWYSGENGCPTPEGLAFYQDLESCVQGIHKGQGDRSSLREKNNDSAYHIMSR